MGPIDIKTVIGLVVAVAFGVGVALFGQHYRNLQAAAATSEHRGTVLQNTSAGVQDGVTLDQVQNTVDQGLAKARDEFQRSNREAQRNEPNTATRATGAVPDSLRSAYRERRRARERLGCAGGECPQDD